MLVPSHSPPGLTQAKASRREWPVLELGRTPKPVPCQCSQYMRTKDGTRETHDRVAPVTPLLLAGGLLAVAASIRDELSREARTVEERRDGLNVVLLVVVGVTLGVRWGCSDAPGVVVGNVGGQTADGGGLAGSRVDAGKQSCGGLEVGRPAEPAGVAGIEVHRYMGKVELLDGVYDQVLVGLLGVAALGDVEVGYQVGKRVGLNNQESTDIGVGDEELADGVDVGLVVGGTVIGNGELAVGGSGSAGGGVSCMVRGRGRDKKGERGKEIPTIGKGRPESE